MATRSKRPRTGRQLPHWPKERPLRAWQRQAFRALRDSTDDSFLVSATPAAGKTTFGLRVAYEMLLAGRVERVVVAAPTTHIARQWALDAGRYGIDLEPNRPNADGLEPRDRHGVALTYQTIASAPRHHARAAARETLLIADEPHHMGDAAAWGVRTRAAFDNAEFRLLLSGTPFRSDNDAIPWVTYDDNGLSSADFAYGYAQALVDDVCRPITFLPYDGEMEWKSNGKLRRADFDVVLPHAESARRLRTALDPEGDWMGLVLRDADERLTEVRRDRHPDAGGLVIASDQDHARAIAHRLQRITGDKPELVMSDEPAASKRLADFSGSKRRWLVSVLMVSEGVDIPRLRVGVYATAARTELFFRQVVGRFIRRTPGGSTQMSYLLLPADEKLKRLALQIEEERRHALELMATQEAEIERGERSEPGEAFEALSSTGATLDDAILSATTLQLFATDDEPPPAALAAFQAKGAEASFQSRERLRERRKALAAQVTRRSGEPHSHVHARINRATGAKSVTAATVEQLETGNEMLLRELRGAM